MVEVGKCRLEPDKGKRVAQILATDVTREQLAEVVWSMERMHATQHDLIMELMNRNAELRDLIHDLLRLPTAPAFDCFNCKYEEHDDCDYGRRCKLVERARDLGIEVER